MLNRTIKIFIATSLDGYIATKEESLDWLFSVEGEGDNGYSEFYETIDTVVMGRRTYDWIMKHELETFPYADKDCYVFTMEQREDTEYVSFVHDSVKEFVERLTESKDRNIWIVGGGQLISDFLNASLIDEMIITIAPVLIGKGIPLFNEADYEIELERINTRVFNQFVELHYKVVPKDIEAR
ncbi:dihydrofolate reductase family protein [Radiobacillus deserti]|uniref:Dihydrofolate reductase n=1 Tax=Radiobacillus deserti TaxID=2594883 RepID=A0A516KER9_9BACI|nr:dihydrofolate reductase family protein [Radiobacillus deserti]QDP39905.1 dihydrofolate reductase [Radiobacillus deserti]